MEVSVLVQVQLLVEAGKLANGPLMSRRAARRRHSVAAILTCAALFVTSASAQDAGPKEPEGSIESEVATVKAENAAVREQLRKMEEQQKLLLEKVERLQQRLDGATSAVVQPSGLSPVVPDQQAAIEKREKDHYQDGIVIWQNPEDATVPFLLKLNNNTQVRYL